MDFDWSRYEGVLFDLDGVLTSTAQVHAEAWKQAFDRFLATRPEPLQPFDIETDYRSYVDGRPRYEGVDTFLRSRGIELPWGDPSDEPGFDSVCALGNLKNSLFNTVLRQEGTEAFPGSVALIDHLESHGKHMAVVSSSKNAAQVLEASGLAERFQVRVDGVVAADRRLAGKPAPDTFLAAAADLGVEPSRAVVVEDAVSGVEAGVAGGFGAVIGVDRHGDPSGLEAAGADVVVSDLGELVP